MLHGQDVKQVDKNLVLSRTGCKTGGHRLNTSKKADTEFMLHGQDVKQVVTDLILQTLRHDVMFQRRNIYQLAKKFGATLSDHSD